jgi:hypothetical protein
MRTMKAALASFDVKAGHYLDDMIQIRVFCFKLKIKSKLSECKNVPDHIYKMDRIHW